MQAQKISMAVALLALVVLGGCTKIAVLNASAKGTALSPLQQEALEEAKRAVLFLRASPSLASAVAVAPDAVLTARHVVPEYLREDGFVIQGLGEGDRPLSSKGGSLSAEIELGGEPVTATVAAIGPSQAFEDDWALLALSPPLTGVRALAVEPGATFTMGEELYLIGYPAFAVGTSDPQNADPGDGVPEPVAIRCEVSPPPNRFIPVPAPLVCIRTGDSRSYEGLSGGAVVRWSEERRQFVCVGIFRGLIMGRALGVSVGTRVFVPIPETIAHHLP